MEKINYSLARRISQWLLREKNSTELENDKIAFSIQLILNDGEKIILIGIFFAMMGKWLPFLVCLGILGTLRMHCGGFHFNSFWSCFLVSLICFTFVIYLGEYLVIPIWQGYILYCFDFILVFIFAPLPSRNRLIYSESQKNRAKLYSCIILAIVICISMFTVSLSNYITWIIVVQIIEIIGKIIYLKKEGVKQNEEHECERQSSKET